jgi:hypothetical protein
MESRITDIQIIYEFTNKNTQTTNGAYLLKFKGERQLFIRNDKSIGTVAHYLDRPASECVSIIRNDVKEEFFIELNKMTKTKSGVK